MPYATADEDEGSDLGETRAGVLIVDDYGYWQGVRQAVDEHFGTLDPRPLLVRIDNSARQAVVPGWPVNGSPGTEKKAAAGSP